MAIILIKWSKTIQCRDKIACIHIPVLPASKLCPVTTLKHVLSQVTGSQNDPLFCISRLGRRLPLTDSTVIKHLKFFTHTLGWEQLQVTFHTFRRSGASWAFQHGIPINAIKDQGTWSSDCVWRYIHTQTNTVSDPLLQAFKLHLPH